jgi:hypothetical protein
VFGVLQSSSYGNSFIRALAFFLDPAIFLELCALLLVGSGGPFMQKQNMKQIQTTTKLESLLCKPRAGSSTRGKTRNESSIELDANCSSPLLRVTSMDMLTRLLQVGVIGLMLCAGNAWAGTAGIQGVVKDAKGQPIKNADVRIESQNGKQLFNKTKTDAKGRYVSQGLQPGVYRVSLIVNGAVKASITNTKMKPDQVTQLNFDLKPLPAAQVNAAAKKGKHMVWMPPATGTHTGGRWVEVPDGAVEAGDLNVQRASGEDLQRQGQSMGVPNGGR